MKTKQTLLLLLLGLFVGVQSISAQRHHKKHEGHERHECREHTPEEIAKIHQKRADFFIKDLELTEKEGAAFAALVNEYVEARFNMFKKYREEIGELRKKDDKSEADYNKLIDSYLSMESQKVSLENDFYKKARKVISAEKLYKYRNSDRRFMQKMMKDRPHHHPKGKKRR